MHVHSVDLSGAYGISFIRIKILKVEVVGDNHLSGHPIGVTGPTINYISRDLFFFYSQIYPVNIRESEALHQKKSGKH